MASTVQNGTCERPLLRQSNRCCFRRKRPLSALSTVAPPPDSSPRVLWLDSGPAIGPPGTKPSTFTRRRRHRPAGTPGPARMRRHPMSRRQLRPEFLRVWCFRLSPAEMPAAIDLALVIPAVLQAELNDQASKCGGKVRTKRRRLNLGQSPIHPNTVNATRADRSTYRARHGSTRCNRSQLAPRPE
jgi:hypothetical protein